MFRPSFRKDFEELVKKQSMPRFSKQNWNVLFIRNAFRRILGFTCVKLDYQIDVDNEVIRFLLAFFALFAFQLDMFSIATRKRRRLPCISHIEGRWA